MPFWKRKAAKVYIEPGLVFNTIDEFRHIECPCMMMHGEKDDLTPYGLSKDYFSAIASHHKYYVESPDVGHVDFLDEAQEKYNTALRAFIRGKWDKIPATPEDDL
jgi:pimeloyl-ACP methyl ester carboxylesterase